jgi:hypothetical protein
MQDDRENQAKLKKPNVPRISLGFNEYADQCDVRNSGNLKQRKKGKRNSE